MYVIKNTETGRFVAKRGSATSYTKFLQDAEIYRTREAALKDLCPGNERILSIAEALGVQP